ncbi:MAG TPA: hypothetical protein PKA05_17805 [Roseiflexaceae bacterium]|nr:hypothetical protein [Roseiflexaceae bacterium]HMP42238.1 hypothetical protein [Roseiflexaceae bacterium]
MNTPVAAGEYLFAEGLAALHERFDPQAGLIAQTTDTGTYHPTRESLAYAYALVQDAGPPALPQAEAIIRRVLRDQERQEGNIHHGGFKWMDEDQGVTDLNAVQFALEQLLPFYQDYGDLLSDTFREELLVTFRAAAAELVRLDVSVGYTNITLLDTLNLVLAGQILKDQQLAARGRQRFDEWITFTCRSGAVPEYNSPTYAAVDLGALAELAERADDQATRIKARVMEERLWLHTATHYHHPTAQLAGPHSRAYHNDVTGGICGIKHTLFRCLGDDRLLRRSAYAISRQSPGSVKAGRHTYHLPDYLERLLRTKPDPYLVLETADHDSGTDLTTYMTSEYALGSVSHGSYPQSNRLICYYRAPAPRDVGVLFSRFIVNEKSLGSHFHATDRSTANNINEEGQFWSVQHENKVIALYGLLPQRDPVHSLKTEVYLLDAESIGDVWVGNAPTGILPHRLAPHEPLLIADGDTYIALRPLEPSRLGYEAPIIVQQRAGELVLSIYNYYQGEPKGFWEYAALSGPFYKRNIRAGFICEVGDRTQYGSFAAFRAHILRGAIDDMSEGDIRRVRYASGADLIEITVDLRTNQLLERRINGHVYLAPLLAAPGATQGAGSLRSGAATLECGPAPAWLVADDTGGVWAAANPSESTPLALNTPAGGIRSAAFGFGRIELRAGDPPQIHVIAVQHQAPLRIDTTVAPRLYWNGRDVSDHVVYDARSKEYVYPLVNA